MFGQIFKQFARKETISIARYAKDHATMTNQQLEMMRNHMDTQVTTLRNQLEMIRTHMDKQLGSMDKQITRSYQMTLAGFIGMGCVFYHESERVDKRFAQVESELKEIKDLVIQLMNKK